MAQGFFTMCIGQAFSLMSSSPVQFSIIWWITVRTGSALALTAASGFWLFCIIVFIMGTTGMMSNIPFTAYIQKTIPQENLGKVI